MGAAQTRLRHILSPSAYRDVDAYKRERDLLFRPAYQFVGTTDDFPRPGDFRTLTVAGTSVLIRRGNDGLSAFVNSCAHRHTALTTERWGSMRALRCPYHGWRYDDAGRCSHIPDATAFAPCKPSDFGLLPCRLETYGTLIFINVAPSPGPLREHLPAESLTLLQRGFASARTIGRWELDHACNWKIPLENVLETYHVPELHRNVVAKHPRLFRIFGSKDASAPLVHKLGEGFSEYHDTMGQDARLYRRLLARAAPGANTDYVHHHAFPNLVLAHSGIVSFVQSVIPDGPRRCRQIIRLLLPKQTSGPIARPAWQALEAAARRFMGAVLREDAAIYPAVQLGLEHSPHRGILSGREERVHAFQRYVSAVSSTNEDKPTFRSK